jgi:signal transduction histidine kinase
VAQHKDESSNVSKFTGKLKLWLSMLASTILPMALGFSLAKTFPGWTWQHYPFHAMLESVGSLSALTISTLIIILIKNHHISRHFIVVSAALIGMGLLDGFHAVLHAGTSFVWLHSIATMAGGTLFSAVWIADTWWSQQRQNALLFFTVIFALLTGLISVAVPSILPPMVIDGQFSLWAEILNITGGIGFLVGTAFFVHSYYAQIKQPRGNGKSRTENLVFANHCLLFGVAGLLFETSTLWDAGWWWWHILRFIAYTVVLIYFFIIFNQSQNQLKLNEIKLKDLNRELEHRVQQRTAELSNTMRELESFSYSVSHDLRAPLRGMDGFSLALLEDYADALDDTGKDYLQRIRNSTQKMGVLIDALLKLSRVSRCSVRQKTVALDELAADIVQHLREAEPERRVDFTMVQGMSVSGDEHLLRIALQNLLGNAWKYTSKAVRARIEFGVQQQNGETIYFIKDNGAGFDMKYADKLFSAFQRLHGNEFEGTGVGLATAQRCIRRHDGRIWAKAESGSGAIFFFTLGTSGEATPG